MMTKYVELISKMLLQSAMELRFKLRQLGSFNTNCDGQFTNCDTIYGKFRQVLQSAMMIINFDSTRCRIKGLKCLQRMPYKKGLSTTKAMSSPKACTYKTYKAVKIYAVYIA